MTMSRLGINKVHGLIPRKFEIQLVIHNNSQNKYLSTINYSHRHKITKIPLHAKITKMPPASLFYQIILRIINYQTVLNSDHKNNHNIRNYEITLGV